ncbi:hypothetical protein [Actinomadura sp. 9N407]|uniref:hypothetical protein n=1 Tax=Actinomadura sp. 9N407 TaxID=3375154 RepID=UPI003795A7A1
MSRTPLRNAAKSTVEVEGHVHAGARAFPADTDRAAAALGRGWATAAALNQTVTAWSCALKRLADEVDYYGDAVRKCVDNNRWAEDEIKQRVSRIRTGAR